MAPPSTPISSLTDQLVTKARDAFARTIKHHNYVRTNQFDVAERLVGLEEKFRVLNNDELADALYSRKTELAGCSQKWLPDVLDLLLHLSDDPIRKSKIENLDGLNAVNKLPTQLRWIDLDRDEPFDRNDPIWQDTVFGGYSSEEDAYLERGSSSTEPQIENAEYDHGSIMDLVAPERTVADDEFNELSSTQFWTSSRNHIIITTEAEAIRETLFALQGLPNSLYWRIGDVIEIDKRYQLAHCSGLSFHHVLAEFSSLILKIDFVRNYMDRNQDVDFLRTLQSHITSSLLNFDKYLSMLQSRLANHELRGPASLMSLLNLVSDKSRIIYILSGFLQDIDQSNELQILDKLFDLTCVSQASGEEKISEIHALFVNVLKIYFRHLQYWSENAGSFEKREDQFPKFLKPMVGKLHTMAETLAILNEVKLESFCLTSWDLTIPAVDDSFRPFSEAFRDQINRQFDEKLRTITGLLKQRIGIDLLDSLQALSFIYLSRNGPATAAIDVFLFERIDGCEPYWNDRFLVTDTVRDIYKDVSCVDTTRLSARSPSIRQGSTQKKRKSVNVLSGVCLAYSLPTSTASVISMQAIAKYQTVALVLIQVRRAIYVLERRCRFEIKNMIQAYSLSQNLLFFVRSIYDHFTSYGIESCWAKLEEVLEKGVDMNAMKEAHKKFLNAIHDHCLVAERFAPLKNAMVSILDLCIETSDIVLVDRYGASNTISSGNRHHRQVKGEEDTSSDSDDELAKRTNRLQPEGSLPSHTLSSIREEFEKNRTFFIAGLRGAGRTQDLGWDLLAQRLDWKPARTF
ncbi:MAG: hypothetical protein Q9227_008121 [Pyrenula ochraceoflavens]